MKLELELEVKQAGSESKLGPTAGRMNMGNGTQKTRWDRTNDLERTAAQGCARTQEEK